MIFLHLEPPRNQLDIQGRGCLIQGTFDVISDTKIRYTKDFAFIAQVLRPKKDMKGENNAKEISDSLPFVEYELHRQLFNKLKVKGMNVS